MSVLFVRNQGLCPEKYGALPVNAKKSYHIGQAKGVFGLVALVVAGRSILDANPH
jgi:hypothetical protein